MARTWLQIEVDLVSGLGGEFDPPPSRVFAVGPAVSFARFAEAINDKLDPREQFGELPRTPVILWGWGWLPDQYGRETDDAGSY